MRVLPRHDRFDRFVSVLVYVPRDRYTSAVRGAIGEYLARAYHGRVSAFHPFFPEGPLVRVHFIIGREPGAAPDPGARSWKPRSPPSCEPGSTSLPTSSCTASIRSRRARCSSAIAMRFPTAIARIIRPSTAVADIRVIEGLSAEPPLGVDFHRRFGRDGGMVGLKIWSYDKPIRLSDRVPVLENMGFKVVDERTYRIDRKGDGDTAHLVPRHGARPAGSAPLPTSRRASAAWRRRSW